MRSIRVVLGVTALILLLVLVPGVMAAGLTQTIDSTQISEATIIGTPQVGNTLTAEVGTIWCDSKVSVVHCRFSRWHRSDNNLRSNVVEVYS